jgi:hypothetical protein
LTYIRARADHTVAAAAGFAAAAGSARQRDARSLLPRGRDQRGPRNQVADDPPPSLEWHSSTAQPSTRLAYDVPSARGRSRAELCRPAPAAREAEKSITAPLNVAPRPCRHSHALGLVRAMRRSA